MPDKLETDIAQDEAAGAAEFKKVESYVKAHTAWALGLGAFILGAIAGHLLR